MMRQPLLFSAVNLQEAYRFIALMISALLATFFFLPLSLVIPKKKSRIVVIGRERGTFSDNAKHFFLFLQENSASAFSAVFLSANRKTISQLRHHSLPCLFYPSPRSLYWLLTSEFIIMDSAEWISGGKFQLTAGSKLIQLWHGAPLKEIELPLHQRRLQGLSFLPRLVLQVQKKSSGVILIIMHWHLLQNCSPKRRFHPHSVPGTLWNLAILETMPFSMPKKILDVTFLSGSTVIYRPCK